MNQSNLRNGLWGKVRAIPNKYKGRKTSVEDIIKCDAGREDITKNRYYHLLNTEGRTENNGHSP